MTFLFPGFLLALTALSIPILVHLFNFRRYKIVAFTNVRFLKEVKKDTQSRNRLKQILVLITRLLLLACIILAFSQPFIPSTAGKNDIAQKSISVYIDNSFSMDAIGKNGPLLEDAKKRARELASSFSSTDRFQLLTNDFEGRHQRMVNKEEFLELLEEVKLSSSVKKLSSVIARQTDALNAESSGAKSCFVLSDFQRSISDLDALKNDTSVAVRFIPLTPQTRGNIFIDSVWFSGPVRQKELSDKVFVRIRNLSGNVIENNPAKLFINGKQRSPSSYTIEPGANTDVFLTFVVKEAGIQHCRIEITDHPVTFDDSFYFTFEIREKVSVLNVREDRSDSVGNTIKAIFRDSLFRYEEFDNKSIDYSAFKRFSLIILDGLKNISTGMAAELNKFIIGGGSVMLYPAASPDLESYNAFLSLVKADSYVGIDTARTKVSRIFYEHQLFADVFESKPGNIDLPVASRHFRFSKRVNSTREVLLEYQNGDPFLCVFPTGKGKCYISSVPLNEQFSNFTRHALFVPVMFQAGLNSQPVRKLYQLIGADATIEVENFIHGSEKVMHISNHNDFDVIPETRDLGAFTMVYVHDQLKKAGNYDLTSGDSTLQGVSFNFDRKESDLACFETAELKQLLEKNSLTSYTVLEAGSKSMADALKETDLGTALWKWFILAALVFMTAEVLLLRFMT